MIRLILPIFLFVIGYTSAQSLENQTITFEGLESFIYSAMKDWQVRGVAVAIVSKDSLIYSKGFGYCDDQKELPIKPETAFSIASIAKPIISLSTIILENEDIIDSELPVNEYLNGIKFIDNTIQNNLTFRDLMLHRSGYARHENIWVFSTSSRKDLILEWSKLTPDKPFRDVFQYSEMNYHTLCYLIEQAAGTVWENYIEDKLFNPLGFENTSFGSSGITNSTSYSRPFIEIEDSIRQVEIREIGVAGSINSSVLDLSRLLQLFLNDGRFNNYQILKKEKIEKIFEPGITVPDYKNRDGFNAQYGYGWIVDNHRNNRVFEHNGQTEGFSGWISILPDSELGVVVLTNNDYSPISDIIKKNLLDRLLNLDQIDYNAEYLEKKQK